MALIKTSIQIDESDKEKFEKFCNQTGMDISVAINIFIKTVLREHKIPFEVSLDPFYFKTNPIRESLLKRLQEKN